MIREVTHDEMYTGVKLAEIDYKMPSNDKKAIKEKQNYPL